MSALPLFIDLIPGFLLIFLKFVQALFLFYVLLMVLPLILQLMMTMVINAISGAFRINIRPIVDLILLPGSLLRMLVIWFILMLFGFELRLGFTIPRFGDPASNVTGRYNYRGLTPFAYYDHNRSETREHSMSRIAFYLSLGSYAVMGIVVLLVIFAQNIIYTMYFLIPSNMVLPVYYIIVISLLLGGMPVPEETLSWVYTILLSNPQYWVSTLVLVLGALIIAPYVGISFTIIATAIFLLINIAMNWMYSIDDERIGFGEALENILINNGEV